MENRQNTPSSSKPRQVPGSSSVSETSPSRSPSSSSRHRHSSIARLASPVQSGSGVGSPALRQVPTPSQLNFDAQSPLAGTEGNHSPFSAPGRSALAAALEGTLGRSPPRFGTPPVRPFSPPTPAAASHNAERNSNYGSFNTRSPMDMLGPNEDPDVVRRHLVHSPNADAVGERSRSDRSSITPRGKPSTAELRHKSSTSDSFSGDEFSSLQLQGGDITREVYRWTEDADAQSAVGGRGKRSKSFNVSRPEPESEELDIHNIKVPGGFRRNFLRRIAPPTDEVPGNLEGEGSSSRPRRRPNLFTDNFIQFLTLYGHFAGEDLEEDDEVLRPNEFFVSDASADAGYFDQTSDSDSDREPGEGSTLLTPKTPGGRRRKPRLSPAEQTPVGAAMVLIKSFVGTGVLFLPKAYLNGGFLFSNLVLLSVAALSYYCFVLLVKCRLKIEGSFGDIGGKVYGNSMRMVILMSVVISQIGFVAAYIVFVSENLQAFVLAVSDCKAHIDIKYFILAQIAVFLPLSLVRNIKGLSATAYIANVFITLGLVYLYYYDIKTLKDNHGFADIVMFNSHDWTLFIGTAIFTFEGIGLIIPIQESMRKPSQFPKVLGIVMVIITVIFTSIGALSYAAYGSTTKTVIILNLPQDDKFVNSIQFLYAAAIMLSTPLQLFPAIRIMETEWFARSGKYNPYIKWQKNIFRFFVVLLASAIAWVGAGDLDKFVSVVGSFACIPLVYIYPVRSLYLV